MHEYGPVILIFVAVLVGILFNRHDISELKADINKRLDRVDVRLDKIDTRLDRIDEDLKQFHGTDKLLEGRLDELSKRVA